MSDWKKEAKPLRERPEQAPTFMSATSTPASNVIDPNEGNIYAAAQNKLREKVPLVISQQELDEFLALGGSLGSYAEASELLESVVQSDDLYNRKCHQFYRKLSSLLEPLRFLQSALDTLCQAHSACSLLWGSIKLLMSIAQEAARIPTVILHGIQDLITSLPIYELYHKCLPTSPRERCPIRKSLEVIYVEYLTFCILARKVARSSFAATFRLVSSDNSPFSSCLRIVEHEKRRVHQITAALTFVGISGLDTKLDTILYLLENQDMTSPGVSSPSPTLTDRHHMVPGLLSPVFVGRGHELDWLESILQPESDKIIGVRAGIYGLTGIGKTQLMLKYEAQHRASYMSQIFLVAPTRDKFLGSVGEVLDMLDLPQRHKEGTDLKIRGLHDWLSQSESWLVLIDNVGYETVDLVRQLLPMEALGHVIVTSQLQGATERVTGSSKTCITLQELEFEDASDMFFAAADIDSSDEVGRRAGTEIVTLMGRVPHAIEQSASYLKVNGLDPNVFLARYEKTPEKILEWEDSRIDYCNRAGDDYGGSDLHALDTTRRFAISRHFRMIFDSLDKSHPDAFIVLTFYSFLQQESIPLFDGWHRNDTAPGLSIIQETTDIARSIAETKSSKPDGNKSTAADLARLLFSCCLGSTVQRKDGRLEDIIISEIPNHPSELLSGIFQDESRRERAIAKLCDLNLVRRLKGEKYLWMHDLTNKTVRATIPNDDVGIWVRAAMDIIYHMMPVGEDTPQERAFATICLPAAKGLLNQAKSLGFEPIQYACLLELCAQGNLLHGSWELSREQFKEARPVHDKYLGSDHPRSLTLRHGLARAIRHTQDVTLAENHFRYVWECRSRTLGQSSPETLHSLSDLASTIERAGRLKEAEGMFRALYDGYEKLTRDRGTHANASPEILAAAHNVGTCCFNQARLAEAGKMYLIAREGDSKKPHGGLGDRGALTTMLNLAAMLDHDARFAEAQAVYDQALVGSIKTLGFDHGITLRLRSNMAALQRQTGHLRQAEEMLQSLLETEIRIYGTEGFETIADLHALGEVWHAKGQLKRAKKAFEDAIAQSGGSSDTSKNPIVPRYVDSLGAVERELGHITSALRNSKHAYERFNAILGWYDPFTLMAANDYAEALMSNRQYQDAWDLFTKCRDSFGTLVGKQHPHYAMVLNNLGRLSWLFEPPQTQTQTSAHSNPSPLALFEEAHAILLKRLGPVHFCTLTVALNIARAKIIVSSPATQHLDESISKVQNTKTSLEASLGPDHPLTWSCDTILGMMFACQACRISATISCVSSDTTPTVSTDHSHKDPDRDNNKKFPTTAQKIISLLNLSRTHLRTAIDKASSSATDLTDSANHILNISLLLLVLRRLRAILVLSACAAVEVSGVPGSQEEDIACIDAEIAASTDIMQTEDMKERIGQAQEALPGELLIGAGLVVLSGGRRGDTTTAKAGDVGGDGHDDGILFDSYISGYIPLFTGESFRLRWGRKNCWRSVSSGG